MRGLALAILICVTFPGCVVMRISAQNPIPGMNTIAVVPFLNLSQEPGDVVDGRRFAMAYYAELQKTPGFEVIPVGVTEAAILKLQLNLRKPEDALELCRLLKADAIVIGAVTDYQPYYPQRIGLQIDWYSPYQWEFPAVPAAQKKHWLPGMPVGLWPGGRSQADECVVAPTTLPPPQLPAAAANSEPPATPPWSEQAPVPTEATRGQSPEEVPGNPPLFAPLTPDKSPTGELAQTTIALPAIDPTRPIMSYTRLFDGADEDFVKRLRDYLELRGDLRSGGWEAHLHRSEDFIRFATHLSIVEMLSLHGGAVKSQMVLKFRKYK